MRRRLLTSVWVWAAVTTIAAAQPQPPCDSKGEGFRAGPGLTRNYHVEVVGPTNARCNIERFAKQQYREPTEAERALLRDGQLLVMVRTSAPKVLPYAGIVVPPAVTQVVLRAGSTVVTPAELVPVPQPWGNAAGAQVQSFGADAWFRVEQVPPGPFTVVVVHAAGGEQKVEIKAKDRAKIR